MDVPLALCLIKQRNGKAWVCAAGRGGSKGVCVPGPGRGSLAVSGEGQPPGTQMQRGGPLVPGQEQVVVFFRKTPLIMKSDRFTRLVMLELGPRAMKTEDGAQDTEALQ